MARFNPPRFWPRLPEENSAEAAEIRRQQVTTLVRQTPVVATVNIVNAGLIGTAFWSYAPVQLVAGWASSVMLVELLRLYDWFRKRHRPLPAQVSKRGPRRATYLALGMGLLWGTGLFLLLGQGTSAHDYFLAAVAAGMAAGCAISLAPMPAAAAAFILSSLLPISCRLVMRDGIVDIAFAMMALTFIVAALVMTRTLHIAFVENIGARVTVAAKTQLITLLETMAVAASEAPSLQEALRFCVNEIPAFAGWTIGHAYRAEPGPQPRLRATDIWYCNVPNGAAAIEDDEESRYLLQTDMPGRVMANGKPAWIADLAPHPDLVDAWRKRGVGLRSGFWFPVLMGTEIVAVLEFFSKRRERPNQSMQEAMSHIGTLVGRVAERERAARALSASEQQLANHLALLHVAMDNIDQGICVINADLTVVTFNPRFLELLGYPPDHFKPGDPFEKFARYSAEQGEYGDGEIEALVQERYALAKRGELQRLERQRPDGSIIEMRRRSLPGGGFVATYTDITKQKLEEAQTHHARKMEALGQLSGSVAHEFNNLLTVIGGFARSALNKVDDIARVRVCLEEVTAATDRASGVTKQMLAFSRRQVLEVKTVRIGDEISNLGNMLRLLIEETIELEVDIQDGHAAIEIDPAHFSQALVNLAVNARDAMPDGGHLRIGSRVVQLDEHSQFKSHQEEAVPGRYVRVFVTDTGVGIPPAVMDRMFEPFFTTKRAGKGTGLGLSTVFGIVKQSNGLIDVDSVVGRGTTVSLYLPVCDKLPVEDYRSAEPDWAGGGELILVAEDEEPLRRLARITLEELGYQVLTAPDGSAALECYDASPRKIDLLVTDVVMPMMGGVRLAQALAARNAAIKVVYMSGYAPELSEHLGALGDDCFFLRKPFAPTELGRMVRQALDN